MFQFPWPLSIRSSWKCNFATIELSVPDSQNCNRTSFILYFLLLCCSSALKLQTVEKLYVLECSAFVTCIVKVIPAQNSLQHKTVTVT